MNILHINTTTNGGAALCALRIANAVSSDEVRCKVLVAVDSMNSNIISRIDPDSSFWNRNSILRRIKNMLIKLNLVHDEESMMYRLDKAYSSGCEHVYSHFPYTRYHSLANHPLVEWADVIHLHWVSGLIDYPTFFEEVNKPIVWTLHDKHPAIGLMHYCSDFFPLPSELKKIDNECRSIKTRALKGKKNIHIVAISELMVDICRRSEILKHLPITQIHNGVDTEIFKPYNKETTRMEFGIKSDATVFLFASYNLKDKNKGFDRITRALSQSIIPNKILICCGNKSSDDIICETEFPIIYMGHIKDQTTLAKLYSASDFFFNASYEETFAQTPLEAMACGTPVISTPCSGASDLIRHFNGIICDGYDIKALQIGIETAYKTIYDRGRIREYIINNYDYSIIGRQYNELYNTLLK